MKRYMSWSPVVPLSLAFVPIWVSGFVVGKLATQRVEVMTTLMWRFAIGAAVMWLVVIITRPAMPRGRAWLHLGVVGLLLQVGQFCGIYLGLAHGVSAGLSSLCAGMAPLLVGLLGPLVASERFSMLKVAGLLTGALGVFVVLSGDLHGTRGTGWSGLAWTAVGMLSLTAGTLYQKRFGASAAIAPAIAAQTTLSLLVMTAVVVVTGSSPAPSTLGGWACVGWLGLGPSCAGFAVFYAVLHRTSTVYVSSLLNLVPGGTALASVPILGEPLTLRVAIGLVIALAGMYVGVVLPGRREHPPRPVQPEPCPQSPPDASSRRPVQRAAR
jgi:drug/metabolite transporter (DMT)-like permease